MIVGAGPVGLTMAAELARHGLSCRVIDKAAAPSATSFEAAIFFHAEVVLGMFPFGAGHYRVVADLPSSGATEDQKEPALTEVQELVERRGPAGMDVSSPTWVSLFHITRRKLEQFRVGRVFLAGDAAHIDSPAGGQGMNTGIQDACNLAWKLALVTRERAPISLLESYTAEREPVARYVLQLTDRLTKIGTLHQPLAQQLRNLLVPIAVGVPFVQHNLVSTLAEVAVTYRSSPIISEQWEASFSNFFQASPAAGDRAPDGPLRIAATGASTRVFEVMRGTRHTLLLFGGMETSGDSDSLLFTIGKDIEAGYGQHLAVHIVSAHNAGQHASVRSGSLLWDVQGLVHTRYGANIPCCYLIRPDGYIGFRSQPPKSDSLRDYLKTIFL